ncbi:MAG: FAD-dependent oxidoreductase [Pseudomonadota bacterium]
MERIVILGAGQAGASLAARLRAKGHAGPIALVGGETAPPYQRPPLSKAYLLGEMPRERLLLRGDGFWAEQRIALMTGVKAVAIDRAARRVMLADGRGLDYDGLALTLGATPRTLPGSAGGGLDGVHMVRSLADIDAMREAIVPGGDALIVGGGYIGLEAAAVLRKRSMNVTLIEAAPRILGRVASAETAAWFRTLHSGHGVTIKEGIGLTTLTGKAGQLRGAVLSDGTEMGCRLAVIGIGILPEIALAEAAGLAIENGIAVDARGQTSDPAIFSAGDCASFPWRGKRIRLESVQNAIEQAEAAADAMLGKDVRYDPVPWFWSDQYDVKLQIAGLNAGHDRVVLRPGPRAGTQSVWYFAGDRLIAVDAMNDPRAYMVGKRCLEMGRSPDPARLADPDIDLKTMLRPD